MTFSPRLLRAGLLGALVLGACSDRDKSSRSDEEPILTDEPDAELGIADATVRQADENEDASSLDGVGGFFDATLGDAGDGFDGGDAEPRPKCLTENIDLLFVIDNSHSMVEEQQKLARVLPELINVLTSGNRSGVPSPAGQPTDFQAARSIHIGVTSSDMGTYGVAGIPGCSSMSYEPTAPDPSNGSSSVRNTPPSNGVRLDKPYGDDGVLNVSVAVALAGVWTRPPGTGFGTPVELTVQPAPECANTMIPSTRPFVEYAAGQSDPALVAQQFGCIAKVGKNGCGIEQQLEAMLKALTPQTSPLRFFQNTLGHGEPDGANRGFLRTDAVLVVVHVSDEDDCSIQYLASSIDLFRPGTSSPISEDLNIRCGLPKYADRLHLATRYAQGLRALKSADRADRVIFASIVGMPLGPAGTDSTLSGRAPLEALLEAPAMQFSTRPDPVYPNGVLPAPACNTMNDGSAAPGRRFVEVAREFGEDGIVSSICQDSYRDVMARVIQRVSRHLGTTCMQ